MAENNMYSDGFGCDLSDQSLNGRWWLLGWEPSSLSLENGEIIELSGALIDHFEAKWTFTYYIHPKNPVSPGILHLTGIPQDIMDQADFPPGTAVKRLEHCSRIAPLLFWDENFQLPFLKKMFKECGKEFALPHMLLDTAARLVLGPDFNRSAGALVKKLGIPVISCCDNKYLDRYLALWKFLVSRLETQGIRTTSQLEQLYNAQKDKEDFLVPLCDFRYSRML